MATTISILSTANTSTGFPLFLTTRKIQISGSDYLLIQSDPNSLNFVYGGNIYSVNGFLYPGATVPPYGTLWQLSTSGGRYYVDFLVNPSILYFNVTWTSLNFPYDVPVPVPNFITSLSTPGSFMPTYNPIVFTFSSPKYNKVGYRYLVDIKDSNNNLINRLKVVPQPDGSGYVDIQKILSNYVSVDYYPNTSLNGNCINSYFKYKVSLGEEYLSSWDYTNFVEQIGGVFDGQVVLSNTNPSITHTYVVGDQITIDTNTSGLAQNVGGLHSVVSVPNNYQVVIDVIYPNDDPSIAIPGSTKYSDSRKTGYSNLTTIDNLIVYNGVFSWQDWKDLIPSRYILNMGNLDNNLLTSINQSDENVSEHNRYYMDLTQKYYINYATSNTKSLYSITYVDSLGGNGTFNINSGVGTIRQFRISYDDFVANSMEEDAKWVKFYLENSVTTEFLTGDYTIFFDRRCKINDIYIYFMDKLGSILSIPFQLRENQSLTVEREVSKISRGYENRVNLDLNQGGDAINHISSKKVYTLNTNWMNDRQMELFEIMMESPYTWLYIDGKTQSCIIEDTSLEIEKYKNKSLFKKNIKVRLSNQDPLNI